MSRSGRHSRRGQSMVEFVMIAPWLLFLFVGAFDWGFFAHGLLSTQNAARAGALFNVWKGDASSTAAQNADCTYALSELGSSVNVTASLYPCNSLPLIVTTTQVTGPDSAPAAQVTVKYQTQNLIPIPHLLPSQYTFVRAVEMRM